MTGDEIRNAYIQFFESKGHLHMPSASLIPSGDPTLLFTSAGMVPFKPFFMGEQTPPSRRLTSSQKSFRTTDIDEVGDHKHLTFFEMLGNFSIGDYFKNLAAAFAWELVTTRFKLPPDSIYITIHLDDDEAFAIWRDEIGVPVDRIYRYGDSDNWWGPAGTEGPTGPCSELHYDSGAHKGCGPMVPPEELTAQFLRERDSGVGQDPPGCHPNCDCERFVELWNLVFMQFYQDPQGHRTPLPAPSVDTGMGLERAAAVLQNKSSVYETDLFRPIIDQASQLSGHNYGVAQETDYALRVMAEHARAAAFLIGDGVVPGNEGRGYVLRRVIRRAIRYGRRLGLDQPFLTEVAEVALDRFGGVYPELRQNYAFILRVIGLEEERFSRTIELGLRELDERIASVERNSNREIASPLPGSVVFRLYDTYGFPPELTAEIAEEHGLYADLEGFEQEMEAQRELSRAAQGFTGSMEIVTAYENLGVEPSNFVGYSLLEQETVVAALLVDNASVGYAHSGQQVELILVDTPFYAESGGQVGDQGTIAGANGLVRVIDTQSPVAGLIVHRGTVEKGDISLGEPVVAQVDRDRRLEAARNHSGTHLLHAALRSALGPHVRQAGSLVSPDRLRFDFSHVGSLTPNEQLSVQRLVNGKIRENLMVSTRESSYAEAVREGALAFFGDRYGDTVRVVRIAEAEPSDDFPFSIEVCGGTHVAATGQVGALLVLGESSIGGGMRRIEAVTGAAAEQLVVDQSTLLESLARKLQAPVVDLESRLDSFIQDTEDLRRRLAALERNNLRAESEALLERAQEVNGVKLVAGRTSANSAEAMREMGDFLKTRLPSVAIVLGAIVSGNPLLVTMATPDLVEKGVHAGNIARGAAQVMGGGGGGQPEMAQAGGKLAGKLDEALGQAPNLIRQALEG